MKLNRRCGMTADPISQFWAVMYIVVMVPFVFMPFIRAANETMVCLTQWRFIVGHDDYISRSCLCWAQKANWMAVFSSCGQSPVWPCISAYAHSRVTGWGHDLSAFVYERQTAQACKITYFMQLVVFCSEKIRVFQLCVLYSSICCSKKTQNYAFINVTLVFCHQLIQISVLIKQCYAWNMTLVTKGLFINITNV